MHQTMPRPTHNWWTTRRTHHRIKSLPEEAAAIAAAHPNHLNRFMSTATTTRIMATATNPTAATIRGSLRSIHRGSEGAIAWTLAAMRRLTIADRRKFGVASMLGVDIDAKLVARAKEHNTTAEAEGSATMSAPPPPAAKPAAAGMALSNDDFRRLFLQKKEAAAPKAPRITFVQSNFVADPPNHEQLGVGGHGVRSFDTILCLRPQSGSISILATTGY